MNYIEALWAFLCNSSMVLITDCLQMTLKFELIFKVPNLIIFCNFLYTGNAGTWQMGLCSKYWTRTRLIGTLNKCALVRTQLTLNPTVIINPPRSVLNAALIGEHHVSPLQPTEEQFRKINLHAEGFLFVFNHAWYPHQEKTGRLTCDQQTSANYTANIMYTDRKLPNFVAKIITIQGL